MRYLLLFLILFSSLAFSQSPPPQPSCTGEQNFNNLLKSKIAQATNNCLANPNTKSFFQITHDPGGDVVGAKCKSNCTCPSGSTWYQGVNEQGNSTSGCNPDTPPGGDDTCSAGQVTYEGFCRDGVDSPDDCGSTYNTAIQIGSLYACANSSGCSDGKTATVFTTATGSWNVCGSGDSGSPSSTGSNTSSGTTTSSPGDGGSDGEGDGEGDGSGSGSGGSPGTGGGDNGGTGSGSTGSGGSTSSASGGGYVPPITNSSASNSSAFGAASSGSGAGNCDPTAHDYLACISRDHAPGEGDSDEGVFSPGNNKGSFDGEAAETRKQELEQQIKDQMQTIRDEIKNEMGGDIRASGGLSESCITLYTKQVCFGLLKWQDKLAVIGQAVILLASVWAFAIVLSR